MHAWHKLNTFQTLKYFVKYVHCLMNFVANLFQKEILYENVTVSTDKFFCKPQSKLFVFNNATCAHIIGVKCKSVCDAHIKHERKYVFIVFMHFRRTW